MGREDILDLYTLYLFVSFRDVSVSSLRSVLFFLLSLNYSYIYLRYSMLSTIFILFDLLPYPSQFHYYVEKFFTVSLQKLSYCKLITRLLPLRHTQFSFSLILGPFPRGSSLFLFMFLGTHLRPTTHECIVQFLRTYRSLFTQLSLLLNVGGFSKIPETDHVTCCLLPNLPNPFSWLSSKLYSSEILI